MQSTFTIGGFRNRHGRVLRAVALFFLVYTCADIALPQYFCAGEAGGLPDAVVASTATVGGGANTSAEGDDAVSDDEGSQPKRPEREAPHEEDCFCCCAHVLSAPAFKVVETAELRSFPAPLGERSVLSPPLPLQYHPPRFA